MEIGHLKGMFCRVGFALLALAAAMALSACPKPAGTGGNGAAGGVQAGGNGVGENVASPADTGGAARSDASGSAGEQVDSGVEGMFPDGAERQDVPPAGDPKWKPMKLTSTAFSDNGEISPRYSRKGNNLSPPLKIDGVPGHAKSLVIIMNDPDAPGGKWTHWVLFNIPPTTTSIGELQPIEGARHGSNSWGQVRYDGPQPPSGTHRYIFTLYALDSVIGLDEGASRAQVEQAMTGHVISTAVLTGTFSAG